MRFNPSEKSGGLKSSSICLLEHAVHMQAQLHAERGWQEKRAVPLADGSVLSSVWMHLSRREMRERENRLPVVPSF